MKILVEQEEKRSCLDKNNFIERKVEQVINVLTETVNNIDEDSEEVTAAKLMICKSWLENLLNNLSPKD